MPFSGYNTSGKPDTGWWLAQVQAGEAFRKKHAKEAQWDRWRQYYRGEWIGDIMPKNIFFSMARTIVPRVYFRNPSVSISPDKPGFENQGFARILERVDNKILKEIGFKREGKRVVQNTFFFGTGFFKVGYGGFYTPTPMSSEEGETQTKKGDTYIEYRQDIAENRPWIYSAHPRSVVVPAGLDVWENNRWVAHIEIRPLEDVRADTRFERTAGLSAIALESPQLSPGLPEHNTPMIRLVEIHDAKTRQVFVIAQASRNRGDSKVIFQGPDDMQIGGGFNIVPVQFNPDDRVFWAVPDSQILEPYQLEVNEIRTQQMKHRRLSIIKLIARRESITEEEAEKLVSETVGPVAWVKGDVNQAVKVIQAGTIPPELAVAELAVMQDVRETVGFSRNQLGEFQPPQSRTSAKEVAVVEGAGEIRIDERRDVISDALITVIEKMHQVMFNHWTSTDVVDIIGPGGAQLWVTMSPELLRRGRYNIKIDPDTATPLTRAQREGRAIRLYELFKTNPIIDPLKLTSFLLHEMHGTQFDDMMRALPAPAQGTPSGTINPEEFGKMLQSSASQAANDDGGLGVADNLRKAFRGAA